MTKLNALYYFPLDISISIVIAYRWVLFVWVYLCVSLWLLGCFLRINAMSYEGIIFHSIASIRNYNFIVNSFQYNLSFLWQDYFTYDIIIIIQENVHNIHMEIAKRPSTKKIKLPQNIMYTCQIRKKEDKRKLIN